METYKIFDQKYYANDDEQVLSLNDFLKMVYTQTPPVGFVSDVLINSKMTNISVEGWHGYSRITMFSMTLEDIANINENVKIVWCNS